MPQLPFEILTPRLRLTAWDPDHAAELRRALDASDAHLRPWIPFMQHEPRTLEQTREWLTTIRNAFAAGEQFRYAVRRRGDGALVGETMVISRGEPGVRELGYWLHVDHCGHGYSREATAVLIPHAFALPGLQRLEVVCDARNAASLRVAAQLGAVRSSERELVERGDTVRLIVHQIPRPAS